MTVDDAVEFFQAVPWMYRKIKVLQDVGLGYITLGQSAVTLSGGEAQRVKLATELGKKDTGKTFYILDEPTTGLHFQDIQHLLDVLNKCFSSEMKSESWKTKLKEMIPTFDQSLKDDGTLCRETRINTHTILELNLPETVNHS